MTTETVLHKLQTASDTTLQTTQLVTDSTEYGSCSRSPGAKKSQPPVAIKIARAAGSKLFSSFPPPRNSLCSSGLASHYAGLLNDGGGWLRRHKYHIGKSCQ